MSHLKTAVSYLFVVLITLVLLEVALRIWASFPGDATHYVLDEDTGYRARAHEPTREGLTLNSAGFNDIDHRREVEPGSKRIAIVGDSFVHGAVARKDNFTFVLADLAAQDGVKLDVMNMGIAAAGPKNYLGIMRHDVAESNADLVAVTIFVGNDITQSHPHFKTSLWLNSTRQVLVKPYYVGWSWEYAYLYRSLRSMLRVVREQRDTTPRDSFLQKTFMEIEKQRAVIYQRDMGGFIRDSYDGIVGLIQAMSQEAKRQNKALLVILAPDEVQISASVQDYLKSHYGIDSSEYDFRQPQSILVEELTERDIAVLDLLPDFESAAADGDLYLPYDTHWNREGNRLAAEVIWRYIRDNSAR